MHYPDRAAPLNFTSASNSSKVVKLDEIPFIGTVDVTACSTESISSHEEMYNLNDLKNQLGMVCEIGSNPEKGAKVLIQEILDQQGRQFKCTSDKQLSELEKLNYPLYSSLHQRSDVTVRVISDNMPVLVVEVHSGKGESEFKATFNKLILCLVELLRFLSNYCGDCSNLVVTGFVFPNFAEDTHVIECKVKWNGFRFYVTCEDLRKAEVKEKLNAAARYMLRKEFNKFPEDLYFLKLSQSHHLAVYNRAFGTTVKQGDACEVEQIATPSSILVHCKDKKKYVKVYPENTYNRLVAINVNDQVNGILLPNHNPKIRDVMVFDALKYQPLERDQAKRCLKELVCKIGRVLIDVHTTFEMAHLDVRLPNICFDDNYQPILIDPDRMCRSKTGAGCIRDKYVDSSLYKRRGTIKTADQLDFMQLGLLICKCLDWSENDLSDHFTSTLIFEGMFVF